MSLLVAANPLPAFQMAEEESGEVESWANVMIGEVLKILLVLSGPKSPRIYL